MSTALRLDSARPSSKAVQALAAFTSTTSLFTSRVLHSAQPMNGQALVLAIQTGCMTTPQA